VASWWQAFDDWISEALALDAVGQALGRVLPEDILRVSSLDAFDLRLRAGGRKG
jgi:hypothetical protein